MRTIYCIPGLGNDHRVFQKLTLDAHIKYIHPIEPQDSTEPIQDYSQRLLEQIAPEDIQPGMVLLGFSLGGILAIELRKMLPDFVEIIQINSIKHTQERPAHMKLMQQLPAYRLIPPSMTKLAMLPFIPLFGYVPAEQQDIYTSMWKQSSNELIRWGLLAMFEWEHEEETPNLTQIHGALDLTFPIGNIPKTADGKLHVVKGGSHVMITREAGIVSEIINGLLQTKTEQEFPASPKTNLG